MHHLKVLAATSGWMLTLTLACFSARDNDMDLFAWAVLLAFIACVPTYWLMFDDHRRRMTCAVREIVLESRAQTDVRFAEERERTEALIAAVAREFARAEVPDLASRRSV